MPQEPTGTIYNTSPNRPSPREVVQIPDAVRTPCARGADVVRILPLRLAMTTAQRLVTKGQLHPACTITHCNSLIPLGGPAICELSQRPYFACMPDIHAFLGPQTCGILRTNLVFQSRSAQSTHTASISIPATSNSVGSGGTQAAESSAGKPANKVSSSF